MSDEHFAKLRNMYLGAPNNAHCVPEISLYRGSATVTITVRPRMFNASGALDNETCLKALMDAAFYSANSLATDCVVVMSSFHVYMVRSVTSGVITAKGQVKHAGKNTYLTESVLTDGSGETVARASGSYTRSGLKLVSEIGYKL